MPLSLLNPPNLGITPSASEVIAQYLREAIIAGSFADDEPLRQDDIARLFNVSKIPVREALKRLEAEGLVQFFRHRGAMVTRISEEELAQIFEVRILLEVQAIRLALPNLTEDDLERARRICDQLLADDEIGHWAQLNWAFHSCLYEAAQRPFLVNLIRSIHDKIERFLRMQMSLSQDGKMRADREHRDILAACASRDEARVTQLVEQHIAGVCQTLQQYLPKSHR